MMAGLILDPGITGHVLQFSLEKTALGQEVWVLLDAEQGVSIPKSIGIPPDNPSETVLLVSSDENRPAIPVYILTDAGKAISTIFAKPKPTALSRYISLLRSRFPTAEVIEYARLRGTDQFVPIPPAPRIKTSVSFSSPF